MGLIQEWSEKVPKDASQQDIVDSAQHHLLPKFLALGKGRPGCDMIQSLPFPRQRRALAAAWGCKRRASIGRSRNEQPLDVQAPDQTEQYEREPAPAASPIASPLEKVAALAAPALAPALVPALAPVLATLPPTTPPPPVKLDSKQLTEAFYERQMYGEDVSWLWGLCLDNLNWSVETSVPGVKATGHHCKLRFPGLSTRCQSTKEVECKNDTCRTSVECTSSQSTYKATEVLEWDMDQQKLKKINTYHLTT